jgi:hypothetical protein
LGVARWDKVHNHPCLVLGGNPVAVLRGTSAAAGAFDVSKYPEELRPYPPDPRNMKLAPSLHRRPTSSRIPSTSTAITRYVTPSKTAAACSASRSRSCRERAEARAWCKNNPTALSDRPHIRHERHERQWTTIYEMFIFFACCGSHRY